MNDPDVGVRRVAAELLGDFDTPDAVPALIRGVDDDDPEVRATALRSLARTEAFAASDAVPERLTDPVPEVRLAALEALDALRADRSRARSLLADPDGLVRARAAAILLKDAPLDGSLQGPEGAGDDPEAAATLARLTRSPYAEVRVAALRALAVSRSPATKDLVRVGLSDPTPSVRTEAARTLTDLDPIGGVDVLLATIGDGGAVLEAADEAMTRSPERAREPVRSLAAASTTNALEGRRLADSIETEGDERLDLLRDFLLAGSRADTEVAIRVLALLADRGTIGTALESLWGADPAARANALEVIETIGDPDLVRPLLPLFEEGRLPHLDRDWRNGVLHHPDESIRGCAVWAIAEKKTAEAKPEDVGGGTMTETMTTLPLMDRVLFLRRVPLFADLTPPDLMPIAAIASEQSFADADTIAEQDEPGDEMHIIVSGYVMVILRQESGHQQVLAVRSSGDVIGEMAVITSSPRMASLAAKGPVRLLSIGRRQFEALLRERPETSMALLRVLCQRLADRGTAVSE